PGAGGAEALVDALLLLGGAEGPQGAHGEVGGGEGAGLRGGAVGDGAPVVALAVAQQEVLGDRGGGPVGLPAAHFEGPEGVAGGVGLAALAAPLEVVGAVLVEEVGDEAEVLPDLVGVDGEAAGAGG